MYELNFIWVGSKEMPATQLNNLDLIKDFARDAVVRIWVTDDTHPDLKKHLLSKGYVIENITQLLDRSVYPVTAEFVDLLRDATLPSGLGDILKFLILTRAIAKGLPTKRFYLEADNNHRSDLKSLIEGRDFMFEPAIDPANQEVMPRPDAFYIDAAADTCKTILGNGYEHVEILLSDPIVNENLKQIIELNKRDGFTHETAVLTSFGVFPSIICKSLLLRAGMWGSKCANEKFVARHGQHGSRSWVNPMADDLFDKIAGLGNKAVAHDKAKAESMMESIQSGHEIYKYARIHMAKQDYWTDRSKSKSGLTKSKRLSPN